MLFMQTEVFFGSIKISCVLKCQNDITCIALKGVKTGCFFGNDNSGDVESNNISPFPGYNLTAHLYFGNSCTY